MTDPHQCPQCGAELPADAPDGVCPKCLMQQGFESLAEAPAQPTDSAATHSGFVARLPGRTGITLPSIRDRRIAR